MTTKGQQRVPGARTPKPKTSPPQRKPCDMPTDAYFNEYMVGKGKNLPNHVLSVSGLGKFIRGIDPRSGSNIFVARTRQQAYRLAAWVLIMAEIANLPDERSEDDIDRPYTYDEIYNAIMNS